MICHRTVQSEIEFKPTASLAAQQVCRGEADTITAPETHHNMPQKLTSQVNSY